MDEWDLCELWDLWDVCFANASMLNTLHLQSNFPAIFEWPEIKVRSSSSLRDLYTFAVIPSRGIGAAGGNVIFAFTVWFSV